MTKKSEGRRIYRLNFFFYQSYEEHCTFHYYFTQVIQNSSTIILGLIFSLYNAWSIRFLEKVWVKDCQVNISYWGLNFLDARFSLFSTDLLRWLSLSWLRYDPTDKDTGLVNQVDVTQIPESGSTKCHIFWFTGKDNRHHKIELRK